MIGSQYIWSFLMTYIHRAQLVRINICIYVFLWRTIILLRAAPVILLACDSTSQSLEKIQRVPLRYIFGLPNDLVIHRIRNKAHPTFNLKKWNNHLSLENCYQTHSDRHFRKKYKKILESLTTYHGQSGQVGSRRKSAYLQSHPRVQTNLFHS